MLLKIIVHFGLQKLFPILTALLAQALSKNKLMIAMISRTVISDKLSAMSFSFQFPSIFQKEVLIIFEIFEHHIISDNLKNLLLELWQISISLFVNATKDNCTEETALKEDKLSFFPALKKYRNRGTQKNVLSNYTCTSISYSNF
jgi:hypothetical protein